MNLKQLLLFLFLLPAISRVAAAPVNPETAKATASAFFKTLAGNRTPAKSAPASRLRLAYTCADRTAADPSGTPYYYVFNRGENEGFIIISGESRAKAVLGYSDEGNFTPGRIPENFGYWLEFYQEELKNLAGQPEKDIAPQVSGHTSVPSETSETSVPPLLGNIKYGQDEPFNALCPMIPGSQTRTVTGCVATSMAQVMRFHRWPRHGKGSHSYTTRDLQITLSADFGSTTYDWDHMPESYTSSNTGSEQENAVATLMLHCGIAVDMNYNLSSGASNYAIGAALIDHFDYDPSLQFYSRPYYSSAQWSEMLKTELSNHRPLIYNGVSSTGGHSFVCDGYDASGLFHINWGWDGSSNGYFELSALNPSEQGTGGGLGGYNMNQSVIMGIRPADGSHQQSPYQIRLVKGLSAASEVVSKGEKATINFGYRNLGIGSFYGYHGMALFQPDGTFVATLSRGALGQQENGEVILDTLTTGSGNSKLQSRFTVGDQFPQGKFRIYPVYQSGSTPDDNRWEIMPGELGMPCYLDAETGDFGIRFTQPEENMPRFTVTGLQTIGNLYQNKPGRFEFTVQNTGSEYTGEMRIKIKRREDQDVYRIIGPEGVTLAANETRRFEFTGTVDLVAGEYLALVQYNYKDGYLNQVGETVTVRILETPEEKPAVTITRLETPHDPSKIDKNQEIVFKATLRNDGGYGEIKAMANIYFPDGTFAESIGRQFIYLDQGEEKEFLFKGMANQETGAYYTRIYLKVEDKEWESVKPLSVNKLDFTLVGEGSNITGEPARQTLVYPNPATTVLNIESEAPGGTISLFDLSGRLIRNEQSGANGRTTIDVSTLPSGSYLLQIRNGEQVINHRFIKKQ